MDERNVSPFDPPIPMSAGQCQYWSRLYGSSKALALVQAAEKADCPVLVITTDNLQAQRLEEELAFYASDNTETVKVFPSWETLPYDHFSPFQDIVSDRLTTMKSLPDLRRGIVLISASTLMLRLAPVRYVQANSLLLAGGDRVDIDGFRSQLEQTGYRCVSQVMEHGDFAIRGSLIDIFPMGGERPYRIDLFDDEIDTIRTFDPETQRSIDAVEDIRMLPGREFPLTEEAVTRFRSQWRSCFEGQPARCPIYVDVGERIAPAGIEYYLPLFFEEMATLWDYLPAHCLVAVDEGVDEAADDFWQEIGSRYEQGRYDIERPLLEPERVFAPPDELRHRIKGFPAIRLSGLEQTENTDSYGFATRVPLNVPVDARAPQPLAMLQRFLASFEGRVLLVAESKGRRESLLEIFGQHGISPELISDWKEFVSNNSEIGLSIAPLEEGAYIESPRIAVVSESQLFGERVVQRRRRRVSRDSENIIRDLTELRIGAPVVHEDHGVGRYQGLMTIESGEIAGEFIHLEYADGDKLYIPVGSLHLISRYCGVDPEHAPLHKLGSGQWQRARARAAKRIYDVAAELLEIYARRAARKGYAFPLDGDGYRAFVQGFPFEETPDQEVAIEAVLQDMQAGQPMDRLICGDVGFGKTEVAMRAAFLAINDGKQVAVLVPTTLLAQQHHENFKDRFADWPIRIEHLSRFRSKKSQEEVIAGLKDGKVDIVIGTHKLLQAEIDFKRLRLLIIDEEHRFGVRQKERLKLLRSEVDILTLTATPIPRSLNMALSGTRELSIIATPPSRRLAVKTFVREWNDALVNEAISREISRGGQVYFLHNNVETIAKLTKQVAELIPQARVRFAHGQMRERELEQVMLDFYHRRVNVLVCTTIIETGIDVPNANTIIIHRADKFGLAQLYQLRGRVGRSHHQAYAYLIVPSIRSLSVDARRRLEAIESLEELGVGFTIATHDLEIRGAGEILGEEQSGHIQEIGFGLYTELLQRAVEALKSGRQVELDRPLDHGTEIDLQISALIPEDYLPDIHARLTMYKRIANAKDDDELRELKVEMIDRFGLLPETVVNLFSIAELKLRAAPLGIRKIDLGTESGRIQFNEKPNVDPGVIVDLIQKQSHTYRLENSDRLKIITPMPNAEHRIEILRALLDELTIKNAA